VALRYQHVMAGRDQAIAAALDELVQAAGPVVEMMGLEPTTPCLQISKL
jgi:hypothetical protein